MCICSFIWGLRAVVLVHLQENHLRLNSRRTPYLNLPFTFPCPLPLTSIWPLPLTALQHEIELIVVLFNIASLKKSINALGSWVPPVVLAAVNWCSTRPRCKMQMGLTDRASILLHSHEQHCKVWLALHVHSLILSGNNSHGSRSLWTPIKW